MLTTRLQRNREREKEREQSGSEDDKRGNETSSLKAWKVVLIVMGVFTPITISQGREWALLRWRLWLLPSQRQWFNEPSRIMAIFYICTRPTFPDLLSCSASQQSPRWQISGNNHNRNRNERHWIWMAVAKNLLKNCFPCRHLLLLPCRLLSQPGRVVFCIVFCIRNN